MSLTELILRLLAAICAGGAVGFEREIRVKTAGLRTHILVSVGAATYLIMSAQFAIEADKPNVPPLDPLRVVGGLIGGIGFLAAGVIIEQRGNVRGLTTAASLWLTAALGAAAGLGQYRLVGLAVVITLLVLWPIHLFERRVLKDAREEDAREEDAREEDAREEDAREEDAREEDAREEEVSSN